MRLNSRLYQRDVLEIAPFLLGKTLVRRFDDGNEIRLTINEVEAYRGEEDKACHARVGRTERNAVMYESGGLVYMFLIYGMYWMLNIVTGDRDHPQAILIRGAGEYNGPGKLTKALMLDRSFYGENLSCSQRLWIEDAPEPVTVKTSPRIGIDYADDEWRLKCWRFFL